MTITSISISTFVAVAGTRTHAAPGADQPTRRRILSHGDVRVGVECRRILSHGDVGVGVECRRILSRRDVRVGVECRKIR